MSDRENSLGRTGLASFGALLWGYGFGGYFFGWDMGHERKTNSRCWVREQPGVTKEDELHYSILYIITRT